ncbi:hypothetical protein BKA82DRAFT_1000184 [Pisolithus tinctorius]|uniref:Uncharacterized protein n=1 Tax=Pisolithus tinctorius Marx 270 TaxID=870435 RepID=A0A0C3PBU4_PISTI|nr:hypothetical protein BKA82DRAFT_1000184 [Pisolithus tinctorius]KIO05174.1 hypothetical protein M404DRAFT_1000184 [Pisolithus tinctorius Marx 270]
MKVEKKEAHISFVSIPQPSEQECAAAAKSMSGLVRAFAWPIHRTPTERRICEYGTKIHLPRTYLATKGEDVRHVRRGTDINQFVHAHYMESPAGEEGKKWTNFVHADEVVARRHEYLGPDPRVAGYFFDKTGEIHIRWWDSFLKDQWMDRDKWMLGVAMDPSGKWVVKEE